MMTQYSANFLIPFKNHPTSIRKTASLQNTSTATCRDRSHTWARDGATCSKVGWLTLYSNYILRETVCIQLVRDTVIDMLENGTIDKDSSLISNYPDDFWEVFTPDKELALHKAVRSQARVAPLILPAPVPEESK